MRKLLGACAVVLLLGACGGGDDEAAPTPTGTHELTGRIMGPVDDARDTVGRLNEIQDGYGN